MLLGGVLTDALDWHWIFLVNLPIGVAVFALSLRAPARLPADGRRRAALDVARRGHGHAALMLAVYAIVNGNEAGWTSVQTLGLLAAAAVLLALFVVIEARGRSRRSCRSGSSACATSRPRTSSAS